VSDVLRISIPLTVWLASFSAIYGLHGLACSANWTSAAFLGLPLARAALVAAWIAAIALQLGLVFAMKSHQFGSRSLFVRWISVTLSLAALVASLWTLFPVVATSACL
jgi:hypothetical protein